MKYITRLIILACFALGLTASAQTIAPVKATDSQPITAGDQMAVKIAKKKTVPMSIIAAPTAKPLVGAVPVSIEIAPTLLLTEDYLLEGKTPANVVVIAANLQETKAFTFLKETTGRTYIRATPDQAKLLDQNCAPKINERLAGIKEQFKDSDYMKVYVVVQPMNIASSPAETAPAKTPSS